mgnify:CR=1 FL=1
MAVKKEVKTEVKTVAEPVRTIYVGPTRKNRSIIQYAVFKGGYPESVKAEITAYPVLKKLFVPVSQLEQARKDIKTKGTILNKYYNQALGGK